MHSPSPAWSRPNTSPPPTTTPTHLSGAPTSTGASQDRMEQPKKPRHRHAPFQLAALNELYEKNEHPSLEDRTALADRLGMQMKTVNSWFQNKRASSKKRHKGGSASTVPSTGASSSTSTKNNSPVELPPISALIASVSAPPSRGSLPLMQPDYEDYSDDEQYAQSHLEQEMYYAGNPQNHHLYEMENTASQRKGRSRPSAVQTEELRKLYDINPHPSKEEREQLGDRIGMRYQSVTNWFQNQRSIAKKRKEEEDVHIATIASSTSRTSASSTSRTFSPFPPAASAAHPSLSLPPASGHPSLGFPLVHQGHHGVPVSVSVPRARRSSSAAPSSRTHRSHPLAFHPSASRPTSPRVAPYRTPSDRSRDGGRPRRTRPEPHQLDALKKLFRHTATPSIEERSALALEIGMDVGKVTNWFRNLRQTARKRARSSTGGTEDELEEGEIDQDESYAYHDVDMDIDADNVSLATYNPHSRSVSRAGTPMQLVAGPSPLMHLSHPPPFVIDNADAAQYTIELPGYIPPRPPLPSSMSKVRSDGSRRHTQGRPYPHLTVRANLHPGSHSSSSSALSHSLSHSDPDQDLDSHMGSEEEYQEAVTPSPESSPPPPVSVSEAYAELEKAVVLESAVVRNPAMGREALGGVRKAAAIATGVKVEDALLLLSFHHAVH